jgi:ProP effector
MSSTSPVPADPAVHPAADINTDVAADHVADSVADTQASEAAPAGAPKPTESPAATAARLAELFPALFAGPAKPFKLRIQVDIQERAPGVFSKQALSAYFRRHTGTTSYLMAVSKGKQRFDLDGQPAGELSDEHRQLATDELARRRTAVNAKREAEGAKLELEVQQRRNRAALLRDFETTKLTTANFCALKGLPVEALDGLLALAREDAKEDALRPRRPEGVRGDGPRSEGRGPGRGDGRNGPGSGPRGPRPEGDRAPREGQGKRPPRRP